MYTLPSLKKKDSSRLRRLVKEWRKANQQGSRQRFMHYLSEVGEEPPPFADLVAAWRAYDEKRKIAVPITVDDAVAVIMQAGVENGLDSYRYLVEVGIGNEELLFSVLNGQQ